MNWDQIIGIAVVGAGILSFWLSGFWIGFKFGAAKQAKYALTMFQKYERVPRESVPNREDDPARPSDDLRADR